MLYYPLYHLYSECIDHICYILNFFYVHGWIEWQAQFLQGQLLCGGEVEIVHLWVACLKVGGDGIVYEGVYTIF